MKTFDGLDDLERQAQRLAWQEIKHPPGKPIKETDIMRTIEKEISKQTNGRVKIFRGQVGQAWTGNEIIRTEGGGVYIPSARTFKTELPKGFSDLFGIIPTFITPEMVGQTIAVSTFIEVKTPTGRIRPEQEIFLAVMRAAGAKCGFARSVEDAMEIIGGV